MLLNDKWIREKALKGMIDPFEPSMVRQIEDKKFISYGTGSFGYDLRLSPKDFRMMESSRDILINPKDFSSDLMKPLELKSNGYGDFFLLPPYAFCQGVALERIDVPRDVTALVQGKSTYIRSGMNVQVMPAEAGWRGHLTIQFFNMTNQYSCVFANEGVVQLLFLRGEPCEVSYDDRGGKYQNAAEEVAFAKV